MPRSKHAGRTERSTAELQIDALNLRSAPVSRQQPVFPLASSVPQRCAVVDAVSPSPPEGRGAGDRSLPFLLADFPIFFLVVGSRAAISFRSRFRTTLHRRLPEQRGADGCADVAECVRKRWRSAERPNALCDGHSATGGEFQAGESSPARVSSCADRTQLPGEQPYEALVNACHSIDIPTLYFTVANAHFMPLVPNLLCPNPLRGFGVKELPNC